MTFTVLFWNIWLENQLRSTERSNRLLEEIKRLCIQYSPDVIGLNEVLQNTKSDTPFVADFIKNECGYNFGYFAPASNRNADWVIGSGFYSKNKPSAISAIAVCNDSSASRRGYKDCTIKAISAKIETGHKGKRIHVIVAHPPLLKPNTIKDHYQATKTLENLVRSGENSEGIILGGDINEPDIMPNALKNNVKDIMHMRTGQFTDPTWRCNAQPHTIIRANLDQLYWTKNSSLRLDHFEVIKTNVSDHRPIVATFSYS